MDRGDEPPDVPLDRDGWRRDAFGGEPVETLRDGSVHYAFGLGPPLDTAPYEDRARRVLEALAPAVRAVLWCRQVHGRAVASLASEPGQPILSLIHI